MTKSYVYILQNFFESMRKWAMADVFAVGILIAYLATSSEAAINAHLEPGYYYFVGYCLISLAAIQVMVPHSREVSQQLTVNS